MKYEKYENTCRISRDVVALKISYDMSVAYEGR